MLKTRVQSARFQSLCGAGKEKWERKRSRRATVKCSQCVHQHLTLVVKLGKEKKKRLRLFDFPCCLRPLDCTTSHTVWFNPVSKHQLCSLPVHQLFHAIFRKQIVSGKHFVLVHTVKIFQPYPFSFTRNTLRNGEGLKMNLCLVH